MMHQRWNTLRIGDAVIVHGDDDELVAGTVAFVDPADDTADANSVGIRVAGVDETYYMWPSLADVHSDPIDVAESCVQCGVHGRLNGGLSSGLNELEPPAGASAGAKA